MGFVYWIIKLPYLHKLNGIHTETPLKKHLKARAVAIRREEKSYFRRTKSADSTEAEDTEEGFEKLKTDLKEFVLQLANTEDKWQRSQLESNRVHAVWSQKSE